MENMEFEAIRNIYKSVKREDYSNMPDIYRLRNIEKEALDLIQEGRCLYTELPSTFFLPKTIVGQPCSPYLSFNLEPTKKDGFESVKDFWVKKVDSLGQVYYRNEVIVYY